MPQQNSGNTSEQLQRLGVGGRSDRLRFRLVLQVMGRCLPLLRDVRWHLVAVVSIAAVLALSVAPPTFRLINVFWTHVLKGDVPGDDQVKVLKMIGISFTQWTPEVRRSALRAVVFATSGVAIVVAIGFSTLVYYRIWILQRINQVLRLRLLDRLQALSLRFHSDNAVGDAIYRMHQDSAMVTQLIDVLILMPLQNVGRLLFSVGLVSLYSGKLALALLAGWPIALFIGYRFSRPMRIGFRSAREHNSALTSLIQASLQGIRVIKAYGAEQAEQDRFERASEAAFAKAYTARDRLMVYHILMFWTFGALVVGATAWAAMLTVDQVKFSGGTALLVLGSALWTLGQWNNFKGRIGDGMASSIGLFQLWGKMQDIAIGLDRVFELLDLEPEVKDAPDAIAVPRFEREIDFEGVCFAYDPDRPTLSDVNLNAKAGTITAIVGPTGSGKSTLMSLLLRLYDPSAGAIKIDGTDLRRFKLESLRANIAIALQENLLFGTTIRENIRYAKPNASDAEVRAAARVAAADEFIEKLPEGYDTLLGERGQKLSTGQRQRLSIARAILKDTPVLILDEPTAALDARTELRVLDNLAAWGKGRAVFLITHRLSTIRRADQVAFIESGNLIELGSHAALMARERGAYRRLVEGEEAAARAQQQVAS